MTQHVEVRHLVDEVETAWIPMRDGRRLAARIFLPRTAGSEPVPVILEYIPYRRRDGTRLGDEAMHRWFAAQGFACARVDVAGTGDSDGLVQDEYAPREQDDGLEVIAWLAEQPWSSGSVGMIGISWGGFNALQLAARRPPALRAVISVCSTVDRYRGDVHFTGGCLNEENLEWGAYFFTMQGLPPDPEVVGEDRWRELWRHRIDHAVLSPAHWLRHQRRDSFWKHGSVVENLSALEVPVLAVSGWADGYTGGVFDLVEGLGPTSRGIIGPWGHKYPQDGVPGPATGFLQEAARWWGRWLRGEDTGVEADPAMRIWLQESVTPAGHLPHRPGTWIGMDEWPPSDSPGSRWLIGDGRFGTQARTARGTASVCSPQTTGLSAGQWCAYGLGKIAPELPLDQRSDDAGSLVFDSDVLIAPLHLVGRPSVRLRVSSDQPVAFVAVRLNEVHPNGTSERLSYGILNLCHRDGPEQPALLDPGQVYEVEVPLKGIAQTVPVGHRVRMAISTSYWPMIWPSPRPATVTVHEQGSSAFLPIRDQVTTLAPETFGPPQDAVSGPVTVLREGREARSVRHDLGERRTEFVASRDDGVYVLDDIGSEQSFTRVRSSSVQADEPTSARADVQCRATYRRGAWDARIESDVSMTCTAEAFLMTARLTAYDGGQVFAERRFEYSIDRDHV